jgi:hypothetical protein
MALTAVEYDKQLQTNYPDYEKLQIESLRNYSFKWFKPINILLRAGYDGLNAYFTENRLGRGITNYKNFLSFEIDGKITKPNTIPEAIENVKMRIDKIDSAFLNAAPRTNGEEMIVWRGKKGDYYDVSHEIHTVSPSERNIDSGYISTTEDIEIALRFINDDKKEKTYKKTKQYCCLYRIHIMEGTPYIDMTNLSQYKESEILLPRDLKITNVENDDKSKEISEEYKVKVIDIRVEKSKANQFDKELVGGKNTKTQRKNKRKNKLKNRLKSKVKNRQTKRKIKKKTKTVY